jgi:hypothetical protein
MKCDENASIVVDGRHSAMADLLGETKFRHHPHFNCGRTIGRSTACHHQINPLMLTN